MQAQSRQQKYGARLVLGLLWFWFWFWSTTNRSLENLYVPRRCLVAEKHDPEETVLLGAKTCRAHVQKYWNSDSCLAADRTKVCVAAVLVACMLLAYVKLEEGRRHIFAELARVTEDKTTRVCGRRTVEQGPCGWKQVIGEEVLPMQVCRRRTCS